MKAGSLDRRVKILRRLPARDDGFATVPGEFALLAERWASVKPRPGSETTEAGGRTGHAVLSFWLRFDRVTRSIGERDALELDGRRFELIAPPLEIGRREGIELLGVAGGLPE